MIVVATYDATGSSLQEVKAITAPGITGPLKVTASLLGGLGGLIQFIGERAGSFSYSYPLDRLLPL